MGCRIFRNPFLRLLLWAALVPSPCAEAQKLPLTSYTRSSGLLSDYITCMAQDRDGFIWFGSDRGLSRYDGNSFTQYTASEGLHDPFIKCLYADDDGSVWAGTHQGGLLRFAVTGITRFDTADGLPANQVNDIRRDKTGVLFVQTAGGLAWMKDNRFDTADGARRTMLLTRMNDGTILAVRDGSLLTIRADGPEGFRSADAGLPAGGLAALLPLVNPGGFQAANGDFYFRSQRGMVRVPPFPGSGLGASESLVGGSVIDIAETRDGAVWAGTEALGLVRIDGDAVVRYAAPDGLPGKRIESLFVDYEGNLWVSVFGHGVRKLNAFNVARYTRSDGLPGEHAQCFALDAGDRLWIGTQDGAAVRSGTSFRTAPNPEGFFNELRAIVRGPGELLYAGTLRSLLGPFDPAAVLEGARVRRLGVPFGVSGLSIDPRSGTVLVGTFGDGLMALEGDTLKRYARSGGLPGAMVEGLVEGTHGPWVLTRNRGALRLDDTGFVPWTSAAGLTTNAVYSVLDTGPAGAGGSEIWLGTDLGLFRHDGRSLHRVAEERGLRGAPVFALLRFGAHGNAAIGERGAGDVYALTPHALYRVRDDAAAIVQPVSFLKTLDAAPNGAFLEERDSTLWIGTTGGAFSVDLRRLPSPPPPPRVVITSIRSARTDQPVTVTSGGAAPSLGEIAHDQGDLVVEYAALSFGDEQAVRYRTRLEPVDTGFSAPADAGSIRFRGLSDGEYRLLVVAVNEWDIESSSPAELVFTVLPPFWKRWWFVAGTAALLLGTAVWGMRAGAARRVRTALAGLERERALQEERERISRDLHDHVGGQIAGLITGLELAKRFGPADDARRREVLDGLREDARTSMETLRETIWALKPSALTPETFCAELGKYGSRHFAYLPSVRFTCVSRVSRPARLSPHEVLELYRVAQESISNAIRHSAPTRMEIVFREAGEGELALEMTNDGAGDSPSPAGPLSGQGLGNMRTRMASIGGRLDCGRHPDGRFVVTASFRPQGGL